MKLLLLCLLRILLQVPAESTFYNIKFETLNGAVMKTSDFSGKKVIIAVLSANAKGVSMVRFLDSLQNYSQPLAIVVIPTGDFNGNISNKDIKKLAKDLDLIITKPLKVKKANGSLQHPLFVWLTQAKENSHFDGDVNGEGQVFVINEKGTLYSVLPKDAPRDLLPLSLNEFPIE